jgi:transposase-like protein
MKKEKIQSIISKIKNENQFKKSKSKRYSTKLKQKIILFIEDEKMSNTAAAKLFNIGNSTIDKWRVKLSLKPTFHKIHSPKNVKVTRKKVNSIDAIKVNQVVLIILTIVLISEVLFLHLSV